MPQNAVVAGYYYQAINKDAPHPAAARLWQEFLYSDEGQNLYAVGGVRPVRADQMKAAGTVDDTAFGGLPVIDGPVTMTVPNGSNTGTTLRLRGRGVRDQKSGQRGDQYVRLQVALPKTQDAELEEFARRWAGDHAYDPRAELRRSA